MQLNDFEKKIETNKIEALLKDEIGDFLELLVLSEELKYLSFSYFDYEYNEFFFQRAVNNLGENILEDKSLEKEELILKDGDLILGQLKSSKALSSSIIKENLISKLIYTLKKQKDLKKDLNEESFSFNINLFYDKDLKLLATNLKGGLEGLFNCEVLLDTSITSHINRIKQRENRHIIIYIIEDESSIKKNEALFKSLNELIIIIGPNDHHLSMYCGKLGIENYISINSFKAEDIKKIIINTRNKLLNKNMFGNKLLALCGISGGIGTTTIAMNMADILAKKLPFKNILYVDLSSTKAISNLFLEKNPLPEKTIIDLINTSEFNIDSNLENGLIKKSENFYCITGIQKHIDKEYLEQDVFIEKLLTYLLDASDYFNFIIIDLGEADASNLKTTIYDLVNDLWLITEMNLPHVAKLKTFYSLMKRAGLKEKISFIVNRYDSANAISVNDVSSILNMSSGDKLLFDDFKIPNDYVSLGKCWNYCELANEQAKNSPFIKKLELILEKKAFFIKEENEKESWFKNLFKRRKK